MGSQMRKRGWEEDDLDTRPRDGEHKRQKLLNDFLVSSQRNIVQSEHLPRHAAMQKKQLRQSVLALSPTPAVTSCRLCGLTYTKGATEDEALHKSHCSYVRSGNEWTHEEEKELVNNPSLALVDSHVQLSSGVHGKIIALRANTGGRIGAKLNTVMSTINTALSSPPLKQTAIDVSKVYLFLVSTQSVQKKRIVGCVVAQNIDTALQVAKPSNPEHAGSNDLVHVDQGLYCDPSPLPTPVGISRILVSMDCRRKGVAESLLNEVCRTFIHGCHLDPGKGQIAFSQPTGDGQKLMTRWGRGGVRIFEE
ncbi:hypothetical protein FRC20_001868 [Serendipita sp. 405]|nr:hypothetical protein FRC20_001868 [Serendipita sp. 405]